MLRAWGKFSTTVQATSDVAGRGAWCISPEREFESQTAELKRFDRFDVLIPRAVLVK
jgi:hypothetical protein